MGAITTVITIVYRSKPMFLFFGIIREFKARTFAIKTTSTRLSACIIAFIHLSTLQHRNTNPKKWIAASLECRKCYLITMRIARVRLAINSVEIETARVYDA